jgi:glyceraldehyde 3-phosphate dehydrogenase
MIPTKTGAAESINLVIPKLAGKIKGGAIRVPTPNVSMIDLNFITKENLSKEALNDALKNYASKYPNILNIAPPNLVSIDFNHTIYSSILDANETKILGNNYGKILCWYDNEWAFSCRMLDMTNLIMKSNGLN